MSWSLNIIGSKHFNAKKGIDKYFGNFPHNKKRTIKDFFLENRIFGVSYRLVYVKYVVGFGPRKV